MSDLLLNRLLDMKLEPKEFNEHLQDHFGINFFLKGFEDDTEIKNIFIPVLEDGKVIDGKFI